MRRQCYLQLAAEAMGSNNELMHDEKHNNYVIDEVTARVWAKLDNTANVEQPRKALDDCNSSLRVARTDFL
jgi:hypothetical protein